MCLVETGALLFDVSLLQCTQMPAVQAVIIGLSKVKFWDKHESSISTAYTVRSGKTESEVKIFLFFCKIEELDKKTIT